MSSDRHLTDLSCDVVLVHACSHPPAEDFRMCSQPTGSEAHRPEATQQRGHWNPGMSAPARYFLNSLPYLPQTLGLCDTMLLSLSMHFVLPQALGLHGDLLPNVSAPAYIPIVFEFINFLASFAFFRYMQWLWTAFTGFADYWGESGMVGGCSIGKDLECERFRKYINKKLGSQPTAICCFLDSSWHWYHRIPECSQSGRGLLQGQARLAHLPLQGRQHSLTGLPRNLQSNSMFNSSVFRWVRPSFLT